MGRSTSDMTAATTYSCLDQERSCIFSSYFLVRLSVLSLLHSLSGNCETWVFWRVQFQPIVLLQTHVQCLGDIRNTALADVAGLITDKVLSDSPGPLHTLTVAVLAAGN